MSEMTIHGDHLYFWTPSSPPDGFNHLHHHSFPIPTSERELTRQRIQRDLLKFLRNPIPGVWVAIDSKDELLVHALVMGPDDTPYEKGFFYFTFKYSAISSESDPIITCKTTSGGRVTFAHWIHRATGLVSLPSNNIIESNGVSSHSSAQNNNFVGSPPFSCPFLSHGIGSPPSSHPSEKIGTEVISLRTLLIKIQKAMQVESTFSVVESWFIEHEKLRVAVIDMVEGGVDTQGMPATLRDAMLEAFYDLYLPWYMKMAKERIQLDGRIMYDPFTQQNSRFKYASLYTRLCRLQAALQRARPIPIG